MNQADIDKVRSLVAELVTVLKMDGTGSATNRGYRGPLDPIQKATQQGEAQAARDEAFAKAYNNARAAASSLREPQVFAAIKARVPHNLPKAAATTGGHDPVHQGLQKHSIGDTYPWAVVGIGNGDKVHYEVHNLCTGQKVMDKDTRKPFVYGHAQDANGRATVMKTGGSLCSFQYLA